MVHLGNVAEVCFFFIILEHLKNVTYHVHLNNIVSESKAPLHLI